MGNLREPFVPETFYHVYNHGNGDDNIYRCEDNFRYFLDKYQEYISTIADTYAYCLMPNHFHFLVRIRSENVLRSVLNSKLNGLDSRNISFWTSQLFGNFLNGYTKAFNKMYDRKGSLFLDNLKRKRVLDEDYLRRLVHYIHFNPVHHRFVKDMVDWTFSSYHEFLKNKPTRIAKEEVSAWFDGREGFEEYHRWKPQVKPDLDY